MNAYTNKKKQFKFYFIFFYKEKSLIKANKINYSTHTHKNIA